MTAAAYRAVHVVPVGLALLIVAVTARDANAQQPAPPAPLAGFVTNIESATVENDDFRRVIFTTPHTQLVLMSLRPGEDIGVETHDNADQFVRIEAGTGQVVLNDQVRPIRDGSAVVIPAGTRHNIVNTGSTPLKIYVVYSTPLHPPGTVERTRADARHHP